MPGNTRGGKGYKKGKTNRVRPVRQEKTVDVEGGYAFYGIVTKLIGDNTLIVKLNDNSEIKVNVPGRMRKRVWIKKDSKIALTKDEKNNYEIVKVIKEVDNESRVVDRIMKDATSHNEFYDDNIDMDDGGDSIVNQEKRKPSKQTMKKRDIARNRDRDTEQFTDPLLLQNEVLPKKASGLAGNEESESDESNESIGSDESETDDSEINVKKTDEFGNDIVDEVGEVNKDDLDSLESAST